MEIKTESFKIYDKIDGARKYEMHIKGDCFDFKMVGFVSETYCNHNYSKKYQGRIEIGFKTYTNLSNFSLTRSLTELEKIQFIQHCFDKLAEVSVNEFENVSFLSWDLGNGRGYYKFPVSSNSNPIGIRKLRKPKRIYVNTNFKKIQTMEIVTP